MYLPFPAKGLAFKTIHLWRVLITALILALAILPGTKAGVFDGLPLSGGEGLAIIFLLLLAWIIPWHTMGRSKYAIIGALSIIILVQLWGAASLPYGWSVCLRRLVKPETLSTPCEPTAEFKRGQRSYVVKNIDWQRNHVPLFFMNDKQAFNFFTEDEPDRGRLSYTLEASAFIQGGTGQSVAVKTWMPSSKLVVDQHEYTLEQDQPLTVQLPESRPYPIRFFTSHEHANEEYLTITTTGQPWYTMSSATVPSSTSATTYWVIQTILLLFVFAGMGWAGVNELKVLSKNSAWGFVMLAVWLLVPFFIHNEILLLSLLLAFLLGWFWLARTKQNHWAILPAFTILAFHVIRTIGRGNWTVEDTLIYEIMFLPTLFWIAWYFLTRQATERRLLLPWILLFLLVNSFHFIGHTHPEGSLVLFAGGDDELTHEGFARQSLLALNLQTYLVNGEAIVFYYQPLYRYFLSFFHQFWGESMFGPYAIQTWAMSLAILASLHFLQLLGLPVAGFILSFIVGTVSLRGGLTPFSLTQTAFQQSLASPVILLAMFLTASLALHPATVRMRHLGWLGLLWGLAFSLRTDYVPMVAVVLLALFFIGRSSKREKRLANAAIFVSGLLVFPVLVIARNYLVASKIAFMPTSGLYTLIPPFYELFASENRVTYGSGRALLTILKQYQHNPFELLTILWGNIQGGFIGIQLASQAVWYLVPIAALISFFTLKKYQKIAIALLILWPLAQMSTASFFSQHNGNAMIVHYDYIWLTILSIAIAAAISYRSKFSAD